MRGGRALRVEVLETIDKIDKAEWDIVVESSDAPVFYRYDFVAAYERAPLQSNSARLYLVVRDRSGRAFAVLPAYLQASMDPLGILAESIPTTDWTEECGILSHVWHCYDTHVPSAANPREVVSLVCSTLADVARERDATWYGFVNVQGSQDLERSLRSEGLSPHYMWDRFVLDLSATSSMEEYLGSLSKNARHNLRRQRRRADEAGMTVSVSAPPFDKLEEVVALTRQTASEHGADSYYPVETFGDFLRMAGPDVRVIRAQLGDVSIGAWICFVDGGRLHAWAAGIRYDLTNFSPYYLLLYEAVRFAISSGIDILEGGRGNRVVKERNGMKPTPLYALLARP